MKSFLKQHMGMLKSAKAIFFAAIGVAPFLVNQMGYEGIVSRIGALPQYVLYFVGYAAGLNAVDQVLSAKYVRSYQDMPFEKRRRLKVTIGALTIVSIVSFGGLILTLRHGQ